MTTKQIDAVDDAKRDEAATSTEGPITIIRMPYRGDTGHATLTVEVRDLPAEAWGPLEEVATALEEWTANWLPVK